MKGVVMSHILLCVKQSTHLHQGFKGVLLIIIDSDSQPLPQHNQYAGSTGRDKVKGFNGSSVVLSMMEISWKGD